MAPLPWMQVPCDRVCRWHTAGLMKKSDLEERYGITPREVAICGVLALASGVIIVFMISAAAAFFSVALTLSMLVITITDSRRMLVPDALSLPMIPLGLVAAPVCLPGPWLDVFAYHASAAVVGAAALLALRWLYLRARGVIGLGLGDVKLVAVAGAWLGLEILPMTLLFASCAALIATLMRSWSVTAERPGRRTVVPFGSFIAPAIAIAWFSLLLVP